MDELIASVRRANENTGKLICAIQFLINNNISSLWLQPEHVRWTVRRRRARKDASKSDAPLLVQKFMTVSQPNDLCAAPDKEFRQNSNFYNSASK